MNSKDTMVKRIKTFYCDMVLCQNEYAQNAKKPCLMERDLAHGFVRPVKNSSNNFFLKV